MAPLAFSEMIGGVEFPQGVLSFADLAYVNDPGSPSATAANYVDSSRTTGPPDYVSPTGSYSLGRGGSITLQFTNNLLTGSGNSDPDLHIFEIGPDIEDTFVEISTDGILWTSVGKVFGSTSSVDIDQYGFGTGDQFRFVRLTDDPDEGNQSGETVGADIDAVGAISTAPLLDAPVLRIRNGGSAAYSRAIIDDGPLAYWRLNEASGSIAGNLGSLGPSANGTYGPHALLDVPGLRENSVDAALGSPFASTRSGMLVDAFPMPTDSVSISLLVEGTNSGNACLFGYGAGTSPNEFSLFTDGGNLVVYLNATRLDFPSLEVMDGDPHQLAITWTKDGGTLELYLDGSPAASSTVSDGVALESNGVFALGQDFDNLVAPGYGFDAGQSFVGTTDEVAVFDRQLSPEEVDEQWKARLREGGASEEVIEMILEWDSAAGSIYELQGSESADTWETIQPWVGTGGTIRLTHEADLASFFFRLLTTAE
ncbi:LamG-like jellyroll fold domain-containing protein [Luteolibacter marinus]|uniref:LamG-like jellyroll fold domain-containing protein n=1 Tax=Luteolibacter marinus TaxID=2776705 RepID=UPI001866CD65|nr:LamG-like jellyroll fold domain-containing protein [Luteolibacter marinus]